jgi:hypothetical protein
MLMCLGKEICRLVTRPKGFLILCVMLLALGCLGCGGKNGPLRVTVRGSVSVDGRPLKAGMIRFIPTGQTKGSAAVAMIKEGAYSLPRGDGPVVGMHRVEIEATDYQAIPIDDEKANAQVFDPRRGQSPLKNPVPDLYNRRSTLTSDMKVEGENKFDFQLATTVAVPNTGR